MLGRDGVTLSYDDNGNLTSDGARTYTWNERNQLTGISGADTASYRYDALGRRSTAAINGQTTSTLYDGWNPVQLQAGGVAVENRLMGLGLDANFARTRSGVTESYLMDALGSILELRNAAQNQTVAYTYDPYGGTASSVASTNGIKYTGRAQDLEDLYYYRNRYYKPSVGRFISEDPIGLLGGSNLYSYVEGNPISRIDPFGLDWIYSQSTGQVAHADAAGNSANVGNGYAGHGEGLNNPSMQNVPNIGPIPQGTWTIEHQQNNRTGSGHNLPSSMRLTPANGTNTFGRSGFLMHGDNGRGDQSASEGCIILNRNIRNQIGNSGDNVLRVIP